MTDKLQDDPRLMEVANEIEKWLDRPNGPMMGTGLILALAVDSALLHSGALEQKRLPTVAEVEAALRIALTLNLEALKQIEKETREIPA